MHNPNPVTKQIKEGPREAPNPGILVINGSLKCAPFVPSEQLFRHMLRKPLAFFWPVKPNCVEPTIDFSIKLKRKKSRQRGSRSEQRMILLRSTPCVMMKDCTAAPTSIICEIVTDAFSDRFSLHYTQARSRGIAARYGMRLC